MKTLISFLLLCSSLCLPVNPDIYSEPTHFEDGVYRWYVKRNDRHSIPELPHEFAFIEEHGAYYADTACNAEKKLYLTFDAGYENGNIAKILDVLEREQVPAAFFILEHLVKSEAALVRRMVDEGHLVCNHTATHKNLSRASDAEFRDELERMERSYKEVLGCEISRYFRPPEGVFSISNLKTAKAMGYRTIFWSFAYADWDNHRQPSVSDAMNKILLHTHPGAIILLHPTSATNAEILPELIRKWKADGYCFGTLDELGAVIR